MKQQPVLHIRLQTFMQIASKIGGLSVYLVLVSGIYLTDFTFCISEQVPLKVFKRKKI
jgi:hypothetical protein